jgi:hypothetical protein
MSPTCHFATSPQRSVTAPKRGKVRNDPNFAAAPAARFNSKNNPAASVTAYFRGFLPFFAAKRQKNARFTPV